MKKETVKSIKKVSREKIPVSSLKRKSDAVQEEEAYREALKKERGEEPDAGPDSKDKT